MFDTNKTPKYPIVWLIICCKQNLFGIFLQIPRSPLWLLSKQRDESALTSLKWLRGWAPQSFVQKEFEAMLHYRNISDSCNSCKEANVQCTHITNKTTTEAFKLFFHKRNMKPFLIIISLFVITIFSGTHQINPYTVKFLNAYCSEMDANDATVSSKIV